MIKTDTLNIELSIADLKDKDTTVFLVLPANYLGQHGRFLRLFVRAGIEAMAKETETGELRDKQCLFMLDEFFSLGRIDEIAKASGLMRGYGLQLCRSSKTSASSSTCTGGKVRKRFLRTPTCTNFSATLTRSH